MNRRAVLSLPLPCLAALTIACLSPAIHAEESHWSIIQVNESMLPALLTPMSHLVATTSIGPTTLQDNSLGTPHATVLRAVITQDHKTLNQLNTDDSTPAQKFDLPRATDFTPAASMTISHQPKPMSFSMLGR